MNPYRSLLRPGAQAFTLIEVLVVICVMLVLMGFVGLNMLGTQTSQKLKSEAINLSGDLHNALLESVKENRPVVLRLYRYRDVSQPDSAEAWRGWQILRRVMGNEMKPVSERHRMESGIIMHESPQFSTVLSPDALDRGVRRAAPATDPPLPGDVEHDYSFVDIELKPNGSNSLKVSNTNRMWAITFIEDPAKPAPSASVPAANYRTVLIDPFNSRTSIY
jgi:uncharacterized protein (TIGR02596 family)